MSILILAGTSEARLLAKFCAQQGIDALASLAGATRAPAPLDVPQRIGGFGGAAAFDRFLTDHKITAILDATHPFAFRITKRSFEVALKKEIPYLYYERAAWQARAGDDWHFVRDAAAAQAQIAPKDVVFLATGRQSLMHFSQIQCKWMYCRQIDTPTGAFPYTNGAYIVGKPPFSLVQEIALFKDLKIDVLVVKNAGGKESFSKLEAARALGIKVVMINRPAPCNAPRTSCLAYAQNWLLGQGHATD